MKKILTMLVLAISFIGAKSADAQIMYGPSRTDLAIVDAATTHGADPAVMLRVLWCESRLNPAAEGDIRNGSSTSFGIAQIHLPAHPEITKEQALNQTFSLDFMAREMAAGKSWKWSCWKGIYGKKLSTPLTMDFHEVQE